MYSYKALNIRDKTAKLRDSATLKGVDVGFDVLKDLFTLKKGYPVYIAGAPHHGKTEFTLELLMSLSEAHDWKHCVYLGETGDVEEIISELCHKYIGKPFRKFMSKGVVNEFAMSDSEFYRAETWVNEHFAFISPEKGFTLAQFYSMVDEAEKENEETYDTTLIDPFNDLNYDLSSYGGRQDLQLESDLLLCKNNAKQKKRINFVVNHIQAIQPIEKDGIRFVPPALPSQWAGGQVWHRRGFLMILIWRPKEGLKDNEGRPYDDKESLIIVQKAKPKGIGELGQKSLFWDWKKSRYYEMGVNYRYAHDKKFEETKESIQPNEQLFESEINETPF